MAIIFDQGLLERRQAQMLTPSDLCKIAICAAISQEMPQVTVYSSSQSQGTSSPAVFVRFGKMQLRSLFEDIERISIAVKCRYLPLTAEDDGENETAMQSLLDALESVSSDNTQFCCIKRAAERTDNGVLMTCEISFEFRRVDSAVLAENIMRTLEEKVKA